STDTNSEAHVLNDNSSNDQSALSRSRKRARSEVPRMGSSGSNNLSSNPLLRSVNDDQEDSEDDERVALNKGNSRSDIEEDGFHTGNDFDVALRGIQGRSKTNCSPRSSQPLWKCDSSTQDLRSTYFSRGDQSALQAYLH
ncbi:unnamed protein product, partial [Trichobilharzia regenti]